MLYYVFVKKRQMGIGFCCKNLFAKCKLDKLKYLKWLNAPILSHDISVVEFADRFVVVHIGSARFLRIQRFSHWRH